MGADEAGREQSPPPGVPKDPERFYCPFPGCNRSFAELWRLKVHYRAPPDIRGSGKERGHGTELTHCPKCNKALKPGKHHVGCSAGKTAPRATSKRTRTDDPAEEQVGDADPFNTFGRAHAHEDAGIVGQSFAPWHGPVPPGYPGSEQQGMPMPPMHHPPDPSSFFVQSHNMPYWSDPTQQGMSLQQLAPYQGGYPMQGMPPGGPQGGPPMPYPHMFPHHMSPYGPMPGGPPPQMQQPDAMHAHQQQQQQLQSAQSNAAAQSAATAAAAQAMSNPLAMAPHPQPQQQQQQHPQQHQQQHPQQQQQQGQQVEHPHPGHGLHPGHGTALSQQVLSRLGQPADPSQPPGAGPPGHDGSAMPLPPPAPPPGVPLGFGAPLAGSSLPGTPYAALSSIFDDDCEDLGRVPSPPPLPSDFNFTTSGAGGMLFNFEQFQQKMPAVTGGAVNSSAAHVLGLGSPSGHTARELAAGLDFPEIDIAYDQTDDGDLMQLLFGVPDELPTMATFHLHKWNASEGQEDQQHGQQQQGQGQGHHASQQQQQQGQSHQNGGGGSGSSAAGTGGHHDGTANRHSSPHGQQHGESLGPVQNGKAVSSVIKTESNESGHTNQKMDVLLQGHLIHDDHHSIDAETYSLLQACD